NDQMRKRCRSLGFVFPHSFVIRHSYFVIFFALGAGALFAQKRTITEKDLFDFVWIGDPQISPDSSRVAFVRVTVNEKKEGYNTSIWSVPVAGDESPHQLTKGDHDSTPRWSPDGKFLLFLRATEKEGKPEPAQLAILPTAGGDSFVFTDLPKGAGNPVWAPDGKTIAFTSETNAEDLAKQEKKKSNEKPGSPSPATGEHESDVRVITRAVYRQDNEGYSVPAAGGKPVKITTIDLNTQFGPGGGALSLSPDGKQVAFVAATNQPINSYTEPDLWVLDLSPNAKPRNITANFDCDIDGFI